MIYQRKSIGQSKEPPSMVNAGNENPDQTTTHLHSTLEILLL